MNTRPLINYSAALPFGQSLIGAYFIDVEVCLLGDAKHPFDNILIVLPLLVFLSVFC